MGKMNAWSFVIVVVSMDMILTDYEGIKTRIRFMSATRAPLHNRESGCVG